MPEPTSTPAKRLRSSLRFLLPALGVAALCPFAVEGWRVHDISRAREEYQEAQQAAAAPHKGEVALREWCASHVKGKDGSHLLPPLVAAGQSTAFLKPLGNSPSDAPFLFAAYHAPLNEQERTAALEYLAATDVAAAAARPLLAYDHLLAVPPETGLEVLQAASVGRVLANRAALLHVLGRHQESVDAAMLALGFAQRLSPAATIVGYEASDLADGVVQDSFAHLAARLPAEYLTSETFAPFVVPLDPKPDWTVETEKVFLGCHLTDSNLLTADAETLSGWFAWWSPLNAEDRTTLSQRWSAPAKTYRELAESSWALASGTPEAFGLTADALAARQLPRERVRAVLYLRAELLRGTKAESLSLPAGDFPNVELTRDGTTLILNYKLSNIVREHWHIDDDESLQGNALQRGVRLVGGQ